MIRGLHGLFYSSDPDATRAFFRDQLKLPGSDIGEGWWIFDFAEGDLGVHPVDKPERAGAHDVSFYCDDIQGTVAELKSRGVTFTGDVEDHGYGLVTHLTAPGGVTVQLYEPRYTKATARPSRRAPATRAGPPKRAGAKAGAASGARGAKGAAAKRTGAKTTTSKTATAKRTSVKSSAAAGTRASKATAAKRTGTAAKAAGRTTGATKRAGTKVSAGKRAGTTRGASKKR